MKEENKLIAEFMGYALDTTTKEYYVPKYNSGDWFTIDELLFHDSWDWLMPVVEKCKEYNNKRLMSNIEKRLINVDLLGVYKNVIDFINHERRNNKS